MLINQRVYRIDSGKFYLSLLGEATGSSRFQPLANWMGMVCKAKHDDPTPRSCKGQQVVYQFKV